MSTSNAAPGAMLLRSWRRLRGLPGGKRLFSMMVGRTAPYTATIGARCEELEPGFSRWTLRDRRRVRNHLRSVHAIALVNLAEVASGTAMLTALPPGVRGIVTAISMEYLKKARGTLVAECRCSPGAVPADREEVLQASIRDAEGDVVAQATVRWKLSPPAAADAA